MAEQDTEITLGAGKILALFFGLVVLCAIFFGAGYTLGKNAAATQPFALDGSSANSMAGSGAKPSASTAGTTAKPLDQPPAEDLTFYKAVEQKDPKAQLTPEPEPTAAMPQQAAAPDIAKANTGVLPPFTGYIVQIAAVSKQQDADALVSALKRKQYPVTVVTVPNDKLFHVQAGPFADHKDAEALRTRLINDGYNPILKR